MQRRSFIKNTTLTLGALALLSKSTLASFLADPAYQIKMLTDDIGVFTESGGTILFMLGKKGTVVVDSQFPGSAKHCIDEIMKKTKKPFELLVNTHHHGDHTAGNIAFKGLVKNVVAHKNSKINQEAVAVKSKTEDKQLQMMLDIVKEYENEIPALLKQIKDKHVDDKDKHKAEIIFSTVHRCKGMEYDVVELANDFTTEAKIERQKNNTDFKEQKGRIEEEINLLYVAITRAKTLLKIPEDLVPDNFEIDASIEIIKKPEPKQKNY